MTGPIFAFIAAFLFGMSSPLAKLLLNEISPWLLAGLLYLGSGVGMTVIFLIRRFVFHKTPATLPRTKRSELLPLVPLLGVIATGGILGPVFLMYALSQTLASTTSLLLNLEGVFTAALAWVVFKEHYDQRIVLGMLSIIIGGGVLAWSPEVPFGALRGPALVAAACLCWAMDNNLTRKISLADPVLLTLIKSLVAGTTNISIAIFLGVSAVKMDYALGACALGFLCYGLSILCFILALRYLGAARTGAYFSMAPFVGAALSILIWHDPLSLQLLLATALMALGIYCHLSENHEHFHIHEEMVHEHSHIHDEHHQHEHDFPIKAGMRHSHLHQHQAIQHSHRHFPDMHHTHRHDEPNTSQEGRSE